MGLVLVSILTRDHYTVDCAVAIFLTCAVFGHTYVGHNYTGHEYVGAPSLATTDLSLFKCSIHKSNLTDVFRLLVALLALRCLTWWWHHSCQRMKQSATILLQHIPMANAEGYDGFKVGIRRS